MKDSIMPIEHSAALNNVLSTPSAKIVLLCRDLKLINVTDELNKLVDFIKKNSSGIGHLNFALKLFDNGKPTLSKLSVNVITDCISRGETLIKLSEGLTFIDSEEVELDTASISETSEGSVVIVVDSGSYINIWADGRSLREINVFQPKSKPRLPTKFCRKAEDYQLLVQDHYRQHVKYSQGTDHWSDRDKRLLRSNPMKTELIFHKSLWNWLEDHKTGFIVFGEVGKLSPDRTDIEIVTTNNQKYILEIKWLGVNESGTPYTESRIREGIQQIDQYLTREPTTLSAALIVYNGRKKEKFKELYSCAIVSEDDWCQLKEWDSVQVPQRGKCLVFYLDSATASNS